MKDEKKGCRLEAGGLLLKTENFIRNHSWFRTYNYPLLTIH